MKNIEMEDLISLIEKPQRRQLIISYLSYKPIFSGFILIIGILIILLIIYFKFSNFFDIAGIFLTALVTLCLLIIKEGYDTKQLEKKIYSGFVRELGLNLSILRYNIKALENYINILNTVDKNKLYLSPTYRMNFEFWNLIKLNIANIDFIKDYSKMEQVTIKSHLANENIEAMAKINLVNMIESVVVNQLTQVTKNSSLNFVNIYKDYCNNVIREFKADIPVLVDALESLGIIAIWGVENLEELEEFLKIKGKEVSLDNINKKDDLNFGLEDKIILIQYSK